MKMDDIDPFGEHNKTNEQPDTGKTIPFTSPIVITWGCKQETSCRGGKTQ